MITSYRSGSLWCVCVFFISVVNLHGNAIKRRLTRLRAKKLISSLLQKWLLILVSFWCRLELKNFENVSAATIFYLMKRLCLISTLFTLKLFCHRTKIPLRIFIHSSNSITQNTGSNCENKDGINCKTSMKKRLKLLISWFHAYFYFLPNSQNFWNGGWWNAK